MEEKKDNKQCVFAGKPYDHGALICSNKSELVCNNGVWEVTGKQCGSKESSDVIIINSSLETLETAFAGCPGGWNTSDCFTVARNGQPPSSSVPQITITQSQITIQHAQSGGGSISQTLLSGSGGTYYLPAGTHNVNPGQYTHQIAVGYVVNSGEIHSYVCYK